MSNTKQIPCKVAFIQDGLSVELVKVKATGDADITEHKYFISQSKPVPAFSGSHSMINTPSLVGTQSSDIADQSVISCTSHSFAISVSGSLESSDIQRSNVPSSSNRSVLPFYWQDKSGIEACVIFQIHYTRTPTPIHDAQYTLRH